MLVAIVTIEIRYDHDISYEILNREFLKTQLTKGNKADWKQQIKTLGDIELIILEHQIHTDEVQKLLRDKTMKFDLLLFETLVQPTLIFSHIFKVPAIQFSSLGTFPENLYAIGAPEHFFLYPTSLQQRLFNFTFIEYLTESYNYFDFDSIFAEYEVTANALLKKIFGPDTPKISELKKNVAMMFMNIHPIWEFNRPVPQKLLYLGGPHQKPQQDLPKDLKSYLDSSKQGAYTSASELMWTRRCYLHRKLKYFWKYLHNCHLECFGNGTEMICKAKAETSTRLNGFDSSDLLRHPNIKLFITQGGLQSTDEAITAGVPMICIPMLGDQWYNMEQYVHHGIGLGVPMETLTEENLMEAIQDIISNKRYRHNIEKLRAIMSDSHRSSLDRAVWWTEYVLKHGHTRHMTSPAADI